MFAVIICKIGGCKFTELESLSKAGAVAITDDGRLVMNPRLIYEAFQRPARLGIPNTYLVNEIDGQCGYDNGKRQSCLRRA